MDGKHDGKSVQTDSPNGPRMAQEFAKRWFWGAAGAGVGRLVEKYPKSDSPTLQKWWFRLSGNTVFTFPSGCEKASEMIPKVTLLGPKCSTFDAKTVPDRHPKNGWKNTSLTTRKHTPNRPPKLVVN